MNNILIYPDYKLSIISDNIKKEDDYVLYSKQLKEILTENYFALGVALPQIGINKRIISFRNKNNIRVLLNPEITFSDQRTKTDVEGCLSFPGFSITISRNISIVVRYNDENFIEHVEEFGYQESKIIQHEIDHLNGITIVDIINILERNEKIKNWQKIRNLDLQNLGWN